MVRRAQSHQTPVMLAPPCTVCFAIPRRPDTTRVFNDGIGVHDFRVTGPNWTSLPQHFKDNGRHAKAQPHPARFHGGMVACQYCVAVSCGCIVWLYPATRVYFSVAYLRLHTRTCLRVCGTHAYVPACVHMCRCAMIAQTILQRVLERRFTPKHPQTSTRPIHGATRVISPTSTQNQGCAQAGMERTCGAW